MPGKKYYVSTAKAVLLITATAFLSACECVEDWYYEWSDGDKPPAVTPIAPGTVPQGQTPQQKLTPDAAVNRLCNRIIMRFSMTASTAMPGLRYDPEDPLVLSAVRQLAGAKVIGSTIQPDQTNLYILSTIKRSPGLWDVQLTREMDGKVLLHDIYSIAEQE